jgi:7-cyano-7-deazaguanine synthase
MNTAICLVSGGMDSCVSAAIAHSRGLSLAFLHVGYGQLTEERELVAFHDIADHFGVTQRLCVDGRYLSEIGGSALTDKSIGVPPGDLDRSGIPSTYVPFRNANLLSIGTSWAEVIGGEYLYVGAVEEDSSGYPDCRESFFTAFNEVARLGTRPETSVEVVTPLIRMSKGDIVRRGIELKAPLELTWSCYQAGDVACGRCDSCLLRLRGFKQVGLEDPVAYRKDAG